MRLPDKTHYFLDELSIKFSFNIKDLLHYGAIKKLKISTILDFSSCRKRITNDVKGFFCHGYKGTFQIDHRDLDVFLEKPDLDHLYVSMFYPVAEEYEYFADRITKPVDMSKFPGVFSLASGESTKVYVKDLFVTHPHLIEFMDECSWTENTDSAPATVLSEKNPADGLIEQQTKPAGRKPGPLNDAVTLAYEKLYKEGNTEILKPSKIKEFLQRLKEFSTEKHPSYIAEIGVRIENVVNVSGDCIITTSEAYLKSSESRELRLKPRKYGKNAVSKILTALRKKHPLS